MKRIDLHKIDLAEERAVYEGLASLLPQMIDLIAEHPDKLRGLFTQALHRAEMAAVLGGESEVPSLLRLASNAGRMLFEAAANPGARLVGQLDGKQIAFTGFGKDSIANGSRWIRAYYVAAIVRDLATLDSLCAIPADVLRPEGIDYAPWVLPWVETLRAFHRDSPDFGARLIEALGATDPDAVGPDFARHTLDIAVPEMDLLARIGENDAAAFAASLEEAVELHKKYWTRTKSEGSDQGILAFGPLAMACIAHDQGWPLALDTPYLPRDLVEGAVT